MATETRERTSHVETSMLEITAANDEKTPFSSSLNPRKFLMLVVVAIGILNYLY